VTRAQLVAAGVSSSTIARRVACGRLHRLHRGVYAVGHTALRPEGFWLAGVLAGGPGAVLSHRSAAAAWDLRPTRRMQIDVIVPRATGRGQPGLDSHRCRLDPSEVASHRGLPITSPARTLLDLAEVVSPPELGRAFERTIQLDLLDHAELGAVLERGFGRRGLKPLRALLVDLEVDPPSTRSELERLALDVLRSSGLPRPEVNARLGAYEVDLLWRREGVVVELDGYAYHRSPAAFEADRRRDAELQVAGMRVLRVTWRMLVCDPGRFVGAVAALLRAASGDRPLRPVAFGAR
jgi:very-short-patch-repair endonuclease